MKNIHEDEKMNLLLGERVQVIFFDGKLKIGVLKKSNWIKGYAIDNFHFRKSHVKSMAKY